MKHLLVFRTNIPQPDQQSSLRVKIPFRGRDDYVVASDFVLQRNFMHQQAPGGLYQCTTTARGNGMRTDVTGLWGYAAVQGK